jgi:predicted ArsR family transcriptional regulator
MSDSKKYPWLRLLDLQLAEPRPEPKGKVGRPKSPFPKVRIGASMTEDEVKALDELVEAMSERIERNVHRGHLIAFMTFRMRALLQGKGNTLAIPDSVESFMDLAEYLDSKS